MSKKKSCMSAAKAIAEVKKHSKATNPGETLTNIQVQCTKNGDTLLTADSGPSFGLRLGLPRTKKEFLLQEGKVVTDRKARG